MSEIQRTLSQLLILGKSFSFFQDPEHHMHIPIDFIFPIQKKTYDKYGEINFPAQPEKCLEFLYGPKWMFPMKKNKQYMHKIVDNKPFIIT